MAQKNKTKLAIFSRKDCSKNFYLSFCHAGRTTSISCEACGREHYSDEGDYEEGEFERLERAQKRNPEKYSYHSGVSIGYFDFGGKQVVFDCQCNYARVIEDLLNSKKSDILEYFDKTSNEELNKATNARNKVKKVLKKN